MIVELFKGKEGTGWYVRLRGGNGEILVVSESYVSKWNAKRAAEKMFPGVPIEVKK